MIKHYFISSRQLNSSTQPTQTSKTGDSPGPTERVLSFYLAEQRQVLLKEGDVEEHGKVVEEGELQQKGEEGVIVTLMVDMRTYRG